MNYDLPHEYSDVPSKDRLHKEKLSALVEGGVPEIIIMFTNLTTSTIL